MSDLRNVYRLPDGPCAVQFSGGRTSAYLLWHILEAHGGQLPPDTVVLFQNTGREMPETLDFVEECGRRWGVRIWWIEYDAAEQFRIVGPGTNTAPSMNGEPFEAILHKRKWEHLPNPVARYCTAELKVRPSKHFMLWKGYDRWTAILGLRADEAERVKRAEAPKKERWQCVCPLSRAKVSRHDVAAFWRRQPFDLALPGHGGKTPLGNCDGCFLKSEANRAALVRFDPQRAAWWEEMERRTGATFRADCSWSELRQVVERTGDFGFLPGVAFYCDSSLGGCHD